MKLQFDIGLREGILRSYERGIIKMLKRVSFERYKLLKAIHNIEIITANDTEAVILIHK